MKEFKVKGVEKYDSLIIRKLVKLQSSYINTDTKVSEITTQKLLSQNYQSRCSADTVSGPSSEAKQPPSATVCRSASI